MAFDYCPRSPKQKQKANEQTNIQKTTTLERPNDANPNDANVEIDKTTTTKRCGKFVRNIFLNVRISNAPSSSQPPFPVEVDKRRNARRQK